MVKAINEMNGMECLPYTAHILQLVIEKGLLPVKLLIAYAKCLILFFYIN